MDNPQHPDPNKELPPPVEEKLLREPNFWEKFGRPKNIILLVLLIIVIDLGVIYLLRTDADIKFIQSIFIPSTPSPAPPKVLR